MNEGVWRAKSAASEVGERLDLVLEGKQGLCTGLPRVGEFEGRLVSLLSLRGMKYTDTQEGIMTDFTKADAERLLARLQRDEPKLGIRVGLSPAESIDVLQAYIDLSVKFDRAVSCR